MYQNLRVLAIIPARGGSKGIKLKNLKKIQDETLVARAVRVARSCDYIDQVTVSTDHEEILQESLRAGAHCPYIRPPEISGDRVSDWEVLNHALTEMESNEKSNFDIVLMLQPTSPMRKRDNISDAIRMLVDGGYDSVWSVSKTDSKHHPYKQLVIEDGEMRYWDPKGSSIIARQQLDPVYHRNGAVYAFTRECIFNQKTIIGAKSAAIVIDEFQISIDTELDLTMVEFFRNISSSAF